MGDEGRDGFQIKGVHDAERRKRRLLMENRSREARRTTESSNTSLMLIIIVTVFLIVNLPQGIFLAVLCFDSTFPHALLPLSFYHPSVVSRRFNWGLISSSPRNRYFVQLFLTTDNLLILATYPINFAIYCRSHLPPLALSDWRLMRGSWCSMSAAFRETFKRLFCPNLPPLRQGASSIVGTSVRHIGSLRRHSNGGALPLIPDPSIGRVSTT